MSSATPIYRKDIDGLRALAILSVVFFHAFPNSLPGGFVGVDVFFVISGFLISTIIFTKTANNSFSFFDFYWRRIRRIFPALLIVMCSCFLAGWFLLLPDELKNLGSHLSSGAVFASNFKLLDESGYFNTASELKPLLHLWSLSIEEQFYIIWPILILYATRKRLNLLKVCISFLSISFIFCIILSYKAADMGFYSPMSRFWEIAAGAVLAFITLHPPVRFEKVKQDYSNLISLIGLTFIITAIAVLDKNIIFPGFWAMLPVIGTCLLIMTGEKSWIGQKIFSMNAMLLIGLISYPIYLWHWPIISYMHIKYQHELTQVMSGMAVAASIVLAALTYSFVENPLRHKQYSKTSFLTFCSVMVGILCLGLFTVYFEGFKTRLPQPIQKYASISFDWHKYARDGSCHIQKVEQSEFPSICMEKQRPLILLWGDSHGSSLYQGFDALRTEFKFGVTQLSKANCAPLLNYKNEPVPGCQLANDLSLNVAVKSQPDVILLHAYWPHVEGLSNDQMINKLLETISLVKSKIPNAKIVVLGPVPLWTDSLQKNLIKAYLANPSAGVASYLKLGLKPEAQTLDQLMEARLVNSGAKYISAFKELCNTQGCLTRVGEKPEDLTAIDYGHMSRAGATYLVEKIYSRMF